MAVTINLQANALTTLAVVEDELGLASDAGVVDTRLNRYINAASDFLARECNRVFERNDAVVEHLRGFGGTELRPRTRLPILALTSVVVDGTAVDLADDVIVADDGESIIRRSGWPWTAAWAAGNTRRAAGSEYPDIVVTFKGGFVTRPQADVAPLAGAFTGQPVTLPGDLEDACIQLAVSRWRGRGNDVRVRSDAGQNQSRTFGGEPVPPEIEGVIAHYRRIANG